MKTPASTRSARRRFLYAPLAVVLAGGLLSRVARAQRGRFFPHDAELAHMAFVAPPRVQLSGRAEQLGPGVQVRDESNRFVTLGTLQGLVRPVAFRRDAGGNIFRVWILTPEEAAGLGRGGARDPGQERLKYN